MIDQTEYEDRRFWEPTEMERIMRQAELEAKLFGYSLIEFDTDISNSPVLRLNSNGGMIPPDLSNLNDNFGE